MTQQEFEQRTGCKITPEAFGRANAIYMAAGDIDKDSFCRDYKAHGGSEIINALYGQLENTDGRLNIILKEYNELLNFLIDKNEELSDPDLRKAVIIKMGGKEYLRRKVNKGYVLQEDDRRMLNEILSARGTSTPPPFAKINREREVTWYAGAAGMTKREAAAQLDEAEAERDRVNKLNDNLLLDEKWKEKYV